MNHPHRSPLIEVCSVSKSFGDKDRQTFAIREVSIAVYPGECILLLGPSGSGKTTLLTVAAGITPPSQGTIRLLGKTLGQYSQRELQAVRAHRIGFVFQTYRLLDPLSVLDNVALPARFAGASQSLARKRAKAILVDMNISHLAPAYPPSLSQGEKQRVAAARALVNEPQLLIADEPTASLESGQALRLVDLLLQYVRQHQAGLLIATHDLRLADYADRTMHLEDGRLCNVMTRAVRPA